MGLFKKKKKRELEKAEKEEKPSLLSPETKNSIFAIALFFSSLLLFLSLIGRAGVAGTWIKSSLAYLLGSISLLAPIVLFVGALSLLVHFAQFRWKTTTAGSILLLVSVAGLFSLMRDGAAGIIGYYIALPARSLLSEGASIAFFSALLLVGILVTFDVSLMSLYALFRRPFTKTAPEEVSDAEWQITPLETPKRLRQMASSQKEDPADEEKEAEPSRHDEAYKPPPLSLLEADGSAPSSGDIQANKNIIQRTLEEFGIDAEMGDVSVGPTVTQYTLRPAQGINLTRITALSRNLSLALAAHPIRIEAPIPGKSFVGIEIPNKQAAMVRLRSLISEASKKKPSSPLILALGRDVAGESVVAFLDKMPHLLISGSTGSGKSICLNSIITTLLYFNSPRNLRFLLVDPKRVEFSIYEGIPHLLSPVIVDTKKAISALKWTIAEMEHRYELLEEVNSRDIQNYNATMRKRAQGKELPYIVVIIDEMADLMMKYKREVEGSIVRIAQMARAVGIHLITSTQRPSTNVVTGLIKANITARIAFKMPTQIDSRTILDQGGAEKLLGFGDMLFMTGQSHGLKRIQGTFLSDKEVKKVVQYLVGLEWENEYEPALGDGEEREGGFLGAEFDTDDELYEEAKHIAREAGKVSASLLQRKLQIGYARAARLLDLMEEEGVIGPAQGAKPREIIKHE